MKYEVAVSLVVVMFSPLMAEEKDRISFKFDNPEER